MKKIFDKVLMLITLISPRINTEILYRRAFGKKINLKNPKTFNEKICYLKLYEYPNNEVYSRCADKIAVRKYVEEKKCKEILIPCFKKYNNVNEIEFDKLPNKFVMKWNFGWGSNYICKNKKNVDKADFIKELTKMGKSKFYLRSSELHYKNIKKALICEQFIGDDDGNLPDDYKFYCFNGKAEYVLVCSEREKKKPKFYFFDRNWNFCRINKQSEKLDENFSIIKPKNIDKMFEYAEKLSKEFKFVRVDLYNQDGKIYFGELTFTPASGLDRGYTEKGDILLGNKIKI